MPYIEKLPRDLLDPTLDILSNTIKVLSEAQANSWAGIINYSFTRILVRTMPAKKYWVLALGIGTMVCTILEFYRRFVAPYENEAIRKNGDIEEYKEK